MSLAATALPAALLLFSQVPGSPPATSSPRAQELDELQLPKVRFAVRDDLSPDEWRPKLNIRVDGKIIVDGEVLYDPEAHDDREDPYVEVKQWLAVAAARMRMDHIDKEAGAGPLIPDEPILIRPDRSAPFRYVQKVMESCGMQGIQIWKIQLACRTPDGAAGRLLAYLPRDVHVVSADAEPVERVEIVIRVREPGTRLKPGAPGEEREYVSTDTGRFVYGEDRVVEYSLGPFKTRDLAAFGERLEKVRKYRKERGEETTVTIDARPGTIYEDVTAVLDEVLEAGYVDIRFLGAYD